MIEHSFMVGLYGCSPTPLTWSWTLLLAYLHSTPAAHSDHKLLIDRFEGDAPTDIARYGGREGQACLSVFASGRV